LKTWFYWR